MKQSNVKQEAHELVDRLSDDVSWEELVRQIRAKASEYRVDEIVTAVEVEKGEKVPKE